MSEFKDVNGNSLPTSVIKYFEIPRQIATELEAQRVDITKDSVGNSSNALVGSNFIVNLLLSGSMNLVWNVINGLQIIAYMPLFNVKTPGNAGAFNKFFISIASFDMFKTEEITANLMYIPEGDPLSLNLQDQGIESLLIIPNLGTLFYLLLAYLALIIVQLLLYNVGKKVPKIGQISSKIGIFLYWNGLIRFFMEVYLDYSVSALLNLQAIYWEDELSAVSFCNVLSIIFVILMALIPIYFIAFYAWSLQKWN